MIFSELYSAYYNAVAKILKAAVEHPVGKKEILEIIGENAFGESVLNIEPAITEEKWQLICRDGTTPIRHVPTMPLTNLEKRWLKAIQSDPRIRLFTDEGSDLPNVEPLFTAEDYTVFDRYADGDPYEDETYRKNFRFILDAVRQKTPLQIEMENRKGGVTHMILLPDHLEYSEKDDKFRLMGFGKKYGDTINLARIISCERYEGDFEAASDKKLTPSLQAVEFELTNRRNALERVLLHFAHFAKEAEKLDENLYKVKLTYDKDDETEILIRLLSFGPVLKVTAPEHIVELIKDRLLRQKSCGL